MGMQIAMAEQPGQGIGRGIASALAIDLQHGLAVSLLTYQMMQTGQQQRRAGGELEDFRGAGFINVILGLGLALRT